MVFKGTKKGAIVTMISECVDNQRISNCEFRILKMML
jgi:hypothetical protein